MKKLLIISLAFIYSITAIGVTLKMHYCGKRLASVKMALLAYGHDCSCGKKAMKKGCCKNEHRSFKLKDDQKRTGTDLLNIQQVAKNVAIIVMHHLVKLNAPGDQRKYFTSYHGPPLGSKPPLYISNCVYRI